MSTNLAAIGSVFLDGIQFTTDPLVYEADWPKRHSVHRTLGGGLTVQDFGMFGRDMTLRLQSSGQFITQAVVDLFDSRYRSRGVVFPFKDYRGTEADVFITKFQPQPTFLPGLFEYSMELQVVTLTKLRSVAYTEN